MSVPFCCQLAQSISGSQQASGMFYECLLQFGDSMTHQIETASGLGSKHKLFVRKSSAITSWYISCYLTGQECPVYRGWGIG